MKIKIAQFGCVALVEYHLRPLITYSAPSRTIELSIFVASLDATAGSVMENVERISPRSNGSSHCCFCSAVPYLSSTSMLPVSGAEQLNTSGAKCDRPMISHSGAYSRFESPVGLSVGLNQMFQSSVSRATFFSSSTTGNTAQGPSSEASR